jgi:folate-dependent phosphoribosylglycinamide formyltransferase PurN
MKKRSTWGVLFSQSGSEILEICKQLNCVPDVIVTNKPVEDIHKINPELLAIAFERFIFLPKKPTVEEYVTALKHTAFVTLHGYLRVLPPEICFRYNIYNGHPGLITKYSELKGKDPQAKVWNSGINYRYHGHVIHKVVSEVDAGEVVASAYFMSDDIKKEFCSLDNYIKHLHQVSIKNWVAFLKKKGILNVSIYGQ